MPLTGFRGRSRPTCRRAPASRRPPPSSSSPPGRCPAKARRRSSPSSSPGRQAAENKYVGVTIGVMDQFASAFGEPAPRCSSTAARSTIARSRPARRPPPRGLPLGVTHQQAAAIQQRRRASASGGGGARRPSSRTLARCATSTPRCSAGTGPRSTPSSARRAEHIVDENARVLESEVAFGRGTAGDRPPVRREPRLDARPVRDQHARRWTRSSRSRRRRRASWRPG